MKTNLRLPDDLHDELVKAADAAERSLNAEIVYRLKTWESLPDPLKAFLIHRQYGPLREWLAKVKSVTPANLSVPITSPSTTSSKRK